MDHSSEQKRLEEKKTKMSVCTEGHADYVPMFTYTK